ncbi:MAG: 6-phosphofructokinase, partial [Bacteroidales bacterium]|nr:6-phosphofructokinase [Bacteroidales bacterium]
PMDRVLATRYGMGAADMIAKQQYGKMVALKDGQIIAVPLADVSGKLKLVDPNDPMVQQARNIGTCVGDC